MSDHKQHEQTKSKVGDKVEAEKPKAAATTAVDAPAKDRKPRQTVKDSTYRILDGVDGSKFNGQKGAVIKALQKLSKEHGPDAHFSVAQVAAATEGLVSRTPVEASVGYHLKGMVSKGEVAVKNPEPVAKAEKKDEKAA